MPRYEKHINRVVARDLNETGAQRGLQTQLRLFGDDDTGSLDDDRRQSTTSSPKSPIRLFRLRKQP
jgi:hypothetical protein